MNGPLNKSSPPSKRTSSTPCAQFQKQGIPSDAFFFAPKKAAPPPFDGKSTRISTNRETS